MSDKIKVFVGGSYCLTCQCDRIVKGFEKINDVEITDKSWEADLIYVNNPPFDIYIKDKLQGNNKANSKLIFNILDIAFHCNDLDLQTLYNGIAKADCITSISQYTQLQLWQTFGLKSSVIYNPIKDVSPEIRLRGECPYPQFKALMVGRLNDPNKRFDLGVQALKAAGIKESEVAIVGPEPVFWGTYLGQVNDEELNKLYNSVKYVLALGKNEGISLPAVESMICGAIPILCQDLSTLNEFFPRVFGYYPSRLALGMRISRLEQMEIVRLAESDFCISQGKILFEKMNRDAVANNILNVYKNLIKDGV